jgi:hypothetical protein
VSRDFDGEEADAPSAPRLIPGMDLEWPLQFLLRYKIAGGKVLNSSPCYFNLQRVGTETPFLVADFEARPMLHCL